MSMFGWISNAVKTAGRAVHSAVHAVAKATGKVTELAGKIPFVGPGLHGVLDIVLSGPFSVADGIVSGARIDKLALATLKREVSDVKEVAPYVQTVIALVPAVGPGISGVIGAGMALSGGQNINQAMIEGAKEAIPGGAIAQTALHIGAAAMQGKPLDEVITAGIPIPESMRSVLVPALHIVKAVAHGDKASDIAMHEVYDNLPKEGKLAVDMAREAKKGPKAMAGIIVGQAIKVLPHEAQKGLRVGMALGHAQTLQNIAKVSLKSVGTHTKLADLGNKIVSASSVLESGRKLAPVNGRHGFDVGAGLMSHKGLTPQSFVTLRKSLHPQDRKGFDLAVSIHIGQVTQKPQPHMAALEKVGFYATHGMRGATEKQKTFLMTRLASKPEARKGAEMAIREVKAVHMGWWEKIVNWVKA